MSQIRISVKSNIDEVLRDLKGERAAVRKAAGRTLNRIAKQARTKFSYEIRQTYNIKKKDLDRYMTVQQVKLTGGPVGALVASITALGSPISLSKYGAKTTKTRGVTFLIRKGGGRESIGSAFELRGSRGAAIFARGRYRSNAFQFGLTRLPISRLVGPGIPQMFDRPEVRREVEQLVRRQFPKRFDQELRFLLPN